MIKRLSNTVHEERVLGITTHIDASAKWVTMSATLDLNDGEITGVGASKRDVADDPNPAVGVLFALSRALRDIADHVEILARRESGETIEMIPR